MKEENKLRGRGNNRIAVLLTDNEKEIVENLRKELGTRSWSGLFVQLLLNQHEAIQHLG